MEVKSLQEVLEETGAAVIQTVGISMKPLLHARESTVLLRKKDGPCRKNDVVLYIRPDGRYTLHRLVKAGPEWLAQGDYQLSTENIREEWIIGVMEGYHPHPNSPFHSVHSTSYQMYVMILPLLRLWLRIKGCIRRFSPRKKEET